MASRQAKLQIGVPVLLALLLGSLLAVSSAPSLASATPVESLKCASGDCGVQYSWYCWQIGMIEPLYNYCDKDDPGCAGWP